MNNCPNCYREKGIPIQPHYTKHMTEKGETWIAYCPSCGRRTPYATWNGKVKTLEQAKESWNKGWFVGEVEAEDVPMQTFNPD